MVTQEIYAHLLVFSAIRALINQAAEPDQLDPDRVWVKGTLRAGRRQRAEPGPFPLNTWPPP